MTPTINTKELGDQIRRKREALGMSLRGVGEVTGISSSTLSRIENGLGKPDTEKIAAIAKWLDIPVDRIFGGSKESVDPVIYYPHEATPEIVEAHLRNDKNLTPETATALAELFRVAYKQFAKGAGK